MIHKHQEQAICSPRSMQILYYRYRVFSCSQKISKSGLTFFGYQADNNAGSSWPILQNKNGKSFLYCFTKALVIYYRAKWTEANCKSLNDTGSPCTKVSKIATMYSDMRDSGCDLTSLNSNASHSYLQAFRART